MIILYCILVIAQTSETAYNNQTGGGRSVIPDELSRPRYGEDPIFPRDYVIGHLGRSDASEESYQYARRILASLLSGNGNVDGVIFPEQKRLNVVNSISNLGTRNWRIGGGRVEPDGSISFLIRFLGRERSITGELYLQRVIPTVPDLTDDVEAAAAEDPENPPSGSQLHMSWQVDDILLENPRNLSEGKFSPAGTEMVPYERFF
ncbi:MAG: hypothetical protein LBH07_08400 [Treponema sp.]|nr:hypothetical protein [Treponema sp.]